METPLVPQELSGGTRKLLSVGMVLVFLFVIVTIGLSVWYGVQEYHGGFVIVAISTVIFLVCTGVLVNLMRQDKLEDKVKYVTLAQSLGLILLSASLFAVYFGPTAAPTFSLGGSISGLLNQGLILQNDGDSQKVQSFDQSCGAWSFPNKLPDGASWKLSIQQQPPDAECIFGSPQSGTIKGKDTITIKILCTVKYTIGGRVTGLTSQDGVTLMQGGNGARDLVTVFSNSTSFVFPTAVPAGTPYVVTVSTQPRNQVCTPVSGTATGTVSNAPVTDIVVGCA